MSRSHSRSIYPWLSVYVKDVCEEVSPKIKTINVIHTMEEIIRYEIIVSTAFLLFGIFFLLWRHPWHSGSAGVLVNRSSKQSCTMGMIHNKIHIISPGCPRPTIAFKCRIMAANTIHSLIHSHLFFSFLVQGCLRCLQGVQGHFFCPLWILFILYSL